MSAQRYLYLDDDNAVQGPFSGEELLGWLADGYFQPETPLWPAPSSSGDDEAARAAAEKARPQFLPFHHFFPHTKKDKPAAAAAVTATSQPAVAAAPAAVAAPVVAVVEPAAPAAAAVAVPAPAPAAAAATPPPPPPPRPSPTPSPVAAAAVPVAVVAPAPPTPAPAPPAPPAAAAAPSAWFYLDDAGGERGPYPASDMASWFQAGFFNAQTKVRTETEKECRAFGERGPNEETFVTPATATTAPAATTTTAAAAVNIEDVFETDMDLMMDADEEQEAEEGEGEEEGEEKVSEEKSGADSDMKEGTKPSASSSSAAAAMKSLAPSSLRWFYTDPAGEEHGPYTAISMLRWHRAGFFAFNDTPLRRADEDKAVPLSARTVAPSFYTAVIPPVAPASAAASSVQKENRWYYLDAVDAEQGPFTEEQMRGWWNGNFLKPTLRVRQVGEPESAFSPISTRDCGFTRPAPAPLLIPVVAPAAGGFMAPGYAPPPPPPQYPHHPHDPYAAAAAHPYAYQGHNPYGGYAPPPPPAPYGAPYGSAYAHPPPPPVRGNPSGDYSQSAGFSGHRGRGRHVVGGAFQEQRQPHDPLSNYIHPAALDQWQQQDRSKRPRY